MPSDPSLLASSLGRIQIKPHSKPMPRGGVREYGGFPTYGTWDGYRYVYIRKGYKTRKVARLVCEAFNGSPKENEVCMHLDEDSSNNRPENLKWGTQKENLNFPGFIEYCKSRTGENNPWIKGNKRRLI